MEYITEAPSDQLALDLFKGEWSCTLPEQWSQLQAGTIPSCQDSRLVWALEQLGSVEGFKILELGPLEAGHSYMFEKRGAQSVVAVESNTRAYLKCLVVKEILGLKKCKFLLGDFTEFLKVQKDTYDFCQASGVLYHMRNPAELIELISQVAPRIMFWTHFYDDELIDKISGMRRHFGEKEDMEHKGFKYTGYRYQYLEALEWKGFSGGTAHFSRWITRQTFEDCLRHFGFNKITYGKIEPEHIHGPAFTAVAEKS